jgi:threonylcarbamoyladenosine tRNA methylthiotransferase MtaB
VRDSSSSPGAGVRCYYSTVASFYVQNFGCRATQADGAAIERQFEERGLSRACGSKDAQIVVLNTCTVTAAADQDARAAIRRVHRENPQARIVVTGCYAQRSPAELASLPGVTEVIGNSHKHELAELAMPQFRRLGETDQGVSADRTSIPVPRNGAFVPLAALKTENREPRTEKSIYVSDIFAHTELLAAPVFDAANERTRPNLKVQDGCDNRCSFCVIPYVRGQSRSLKLEDVLREANALVEAGYRELVISGINLGRWGRDLPVAGSSDFRQQVPFSVRRSFGHSVDDTCSLPSDDLRLTTLIRVILERTNLEKLRISSVEPMDWSDELISLVAGAPRIAKHAHVPLQSGSDAVLRRMHRKYRPWHYREKIEQIRAAMPAAAIGADVMVGFPGETDAEFEETFRMIESVPLTYLHVFTYSPRPGTPAADMARHVPANLARERSRALRELGAEKKLKFMQSFLGATLEAITLHAGSLDESIGSELDQSDTTEALTDNYLKVRLAGHYPANRWIDLRVQELDRDVLVGVPASGGAGTPARDEAGSNSKLAG